MRQALRLWGQAGDGEEKRGREGKGDTGMRQALRGLGAGWKTCTARPSLWCTQASGRIRLYFACTHTAHHVPLSIMYRSPSYYI